MEVLIFLICIVSAFLLGRLTNFKPSAKLEKLQHELRIMTTSRDAWREKYLVRIMRDKLKEMNCREVTED